MIASSSSRPTRTLDYGAAEDAKPKLEELLRRDPEFAGAADLLAKAERNLRLGIETVEMVDGEDVRVPDETRPPVALTDAQLYREAKQALERGDRETSKARLEDLLERNPNFAGARELMAQARGDAPIIQRKPPQPLALTEPQLFYEATPARENGDFETSRARLEELVRRNPTFTGASELLTEVATSFGRKTCPLPSKRGTATALAAARAP